jgi:hypothetical protein
VSRKSRDLRHVLNREIFRLRPGLARRFWPQEKVKEIWSNEGIRGIYEFVRRIIGKYEDATLAARYQALEHYPAGPWRHQAHYGEGWWRTCWCSTSSVMRSLMNESVKTNQQPADS